MPISFLRLELHAPQHKRYDLAFDSSYIIYRQLETRDEVDAPESICYYISYIHFTTSRPQQPRMELRLQMTCLIPVQLSSSRFHSLHILLVLQLLAQLIETGTMKPPDDLKIHNPYYPDLPILRRRTSFQRHFRGQTLFHTTIQMFLKCLSAQKYRDLGIFIFAYLVYPFIQEIIARSISPMCFVMPIVWLLNPFKRLTRCKLDYWRCSVFLADCSLLFLAT